ncbi:Site-specific DNA recombinase [Psychrobacillus sp. OK028]|uniref:recombinase family protein n=1 Tax=Psychrobacillus sp. OK028 TaxID=1884359 RepID=UPI00087E5E20|nr:recombinase family protein [Psychrobacillus sp. OK028]SDO02581.1 Site-specific DNA recombinase [Psychrobacillus sp. OK028]
MSEKRKIGVGYARVSSSMQAEDGLSLEHQTSKISEYCYKNNIKLLEIFEDAAVSGFHISDKERESLRAKKKLSREEMIHRKRSGLLLLLNAIRHEDIDYVIVTKNDRLGRDDEEKAFLKRECRKRKIEIIYIDQPGLTGAAQTATEMLMDRMMDLLDEFYSMNLGMEVKKIHEDLAKKGLYTGGRVPIGYKLATRLNEKGKDEKFYVIDEESAPTIKLVFNMYVEGKGFSAIANHLNEIKAPGKKVWTAQNISIILKNPNYYTRVWNRHESKRIEGILKEEELWIYNLDESNATIVTKEQYDEVQEQMKKRVKNTNKGDRKNIDHDSRSYGKYLLTGMVFCKNCGKTMVSNRTTSARSKTVGYYFSCPSNKSLPKGHKCSNNLNMQKLDFIVWKELCKFLTPSEIIKEIDNHLKTTAEENKAKNQKLYSFQKDLKKRQDQVENLFDIVAEMDFSNKSLLARYNLQIQKHEDEIELLKRKIDEFGEPLDENIVFPSNVDIVKVEYLLHEDYYTYLDFEVIRAIIQSVVDRIVTKRINENETEVEIFFRFNHPSINEIINFKKQTMKSKQKQRKETVNQAVMGFLSKLFLGIDYIVPSPYIYC